MSMDSVTEATITPPDVGQLIGSVKFFSPDKGFGFIQVQDHLDVFIHANQLRRSGIGRPLRPGQRIKFTVSTGPRGIFATEITLLEL